MTKASEQTIRNLEIGQRHILYDAALIEHPDAALFSPEAVNPDSVRDTASGRGEAVFFEYQGLNLVLKHYHRGGKMAPLLGDRYFGVRPEKTRAFRELRLLHQLQSFGLPAPVPVAAGVIRSGVFMRADLVTLEIPGVTPLADILMHDALDADAWRAVGACIRAFHNRDVYHADLNARNVLLDENGKVFLVDFDKACIRLLGDSWKQSNLARLHRSLMKFKSLRPDFRFSPQDWNELVAAYRSI